MLASRDLTDSPPASDSFGPVSSRLPITICRCPAPVRYRESSPSDGHPLRSSMG
jgi:hypothetical protein